MSQEINTANIVLTITASSNSIEFAIENTKPAHSKICVDNTREAIGLQNIRKQLNLLYPNNYKLDIKDANDTYSVTLQITPNAI